MKAILEEEDFFFVIKTLLKLQKILLIYNLFIPDRSKTFKW